MENAETWNFEQLQSRYLERKNSDLPVLRKLLELNDFVQIGRMAHRGVGNCSMFGFDSLTETYTQMLQHSREQNFEGIATSIKNFEAKLIEIQSQQQFN